MQIQEMQVQADDPFVTAVKATFDTVRTSMSNTDTKLSEVSAQVQSAAGQLADHAGRLTSIEEKGLVPFVASEEASDRNFYLAGAALAVGVLSISLYFYQSRRINHLENKVDETKGKVNVLEIIQVLETFGRKQKISTAWNKLSPDQQKFIDDKKLNHAQNIETAIKTLLGTTE
jgi:hypothetical protein